MSNRSVKLLLEVAQTLDLHAVRNPMSKLSGCTHVDLHPGLNNEIRTWARGYREHVDRIRSRSLTVTAVPGDTPPVDARNQGQQVKECR